VFGSIAGYKNRRRCILKKREVIGNMEELRVTLSEGILPDKYTCDGENRSPPIGVGGVNTAITKSLAILVNDPDAPGGGGFVHWIAWNVEPVKVIPEDIPKTPEVHNPLRAVQGKNSFGKNGYSGPCPPRGQTHRYFFRIYGLDTLLDLPGGSAKDQLVRAMQDHIVQFGETYVTCGR
jgi:Raf kinase inhibitor-like YbhB/YbcL family protein